MPAGACTWVGEYGSRAEPRARAGGPSDPLWGRSWGGTALGALLPPTGGAGIWGCIPPGRCLGLGLSLKAPGAGVCVGPTFHLPQKAAGGLHDFAF